MCYNNSLILIAVRACTSEAFGSQLAEPPPVTVTLERTRLGPDDDGRGVESDIASSRRLNFCEVAAFDRHLV
ncbi:hypothetical protein MY4038_002243 [Beauveria bassiana]